MFITRRHFLTMLAASPLVMSPLGETQAAPSRVIVIGAGIAGLAAARALAEKGIAVTILEGRERIGGRIYTSHTWPDIPLDLGASWIHGQHKNPITDLAKAAQAQRVVTSYDSAALYIDPRLSKLGVKSANEAAIAKLVTQALNQANQLEQDISVKAAVDRVLTKPVSPSYQAQLDFYLNSKFEQEYSGSIATLSAQTMEDGKSFTGTDALFLQGYEQITNYLAQGLNIQLGQTVTKVAYGAKGVSVTTQHQTHTADYAIITVPLGVLKRNTIQFSPVLSRDKQIAIQRLGMGLLNKTYLRFPKVFWPKNIDWHEYLSPDKGRWVEWVSFAKIGAPVLLGFHAADTARTVENWTDQALVADAMKVLKTMFGNNIPQPVGAQITRWAKDPFAYGSYSFNAVGSTLQDRKNLAKPSGRLFWAGEATSSSYQGTVHGAYLSGVEAAKALLKLR
ncbi:flavin monoamine oxidase family protein [Thiolinea disciformis]|uniref:flavin monoamine oxidase family protein n=1 Tax=Thiolinea disciformis TaxID=125614 RepID=UPI00037C134C|nr:FAD-dependent oxidoreductase [Thiolinea disciformis]